MVRPRPDAPSVFSVPSPSAALVSRPSSLGPRLSALVSRPSSLGPRLSALVSRPSSLGPRLSTLVSRLSSLVSRLSSLGSRLSVVPSTSARRALCSALPPAPLRRGRPRRLPFGGSDASAGPITALSPPCSTGRSVVPSLSVRRFRAAHALSTERRNVQSTVGNFWTEHEAMERITQLEKTIKAKKRETRHYSRKRRAAHGVRKARTARGDGRAGRRLRDHHVPTAVPGVVFEITVFPRPCRASSSRSPCSRASSATPARASCPTCRKVEWAREDTCRLQSFLLRFAP